MLLRRILMKRLMELLAIRLSEQTALHSHSAKSPKYGDISRWLTLAKSLVIAIPPDWQKTPVKWLVMALSLLTASTTVLADAVDINLSNDVAQFQYLAPMGHIGQGKSEFHMGFLYNNSNDGLADAGIMVMNGDGSVSGVALGVGVKALTATVDRNNSLALAIGGRVRFSPLADNRLGVVGQVHLAPDIVTFGDADRFVQTGVRLEYEILPQAVAYVGYRKIKFGNKEAAPAPDELLDEGAHIGVRIAF